VSPELSTRTINFVPCQRHLFDIRGRYISELCLHVAASSGGDWEQPALARVSGPWELTSKFFTGAENFERQRRSHRYCGGLCGNRFIGELWHRDRHAESAGKQGSVSFCSMNISVKLISRGNGWRSVAGTKTSRGGRCDWTAASSVATDDVAVAGSSSRTDSGGKLTLCGSEKPAERWAQRWFLISRRWGVPFSVREVQRDFAVAAITSG
jgi:hypothetical protein